MDCPLPCMAKPPLALALPALCPRCVSGQVTSPALGQVTPPPSPPGGRPSPATISAHQPTLPSVRPNVPQPQTTYALDRARPPQPPQSPSLASSPPLTSPLLTVTISGAPSYSMMSVKPVVEPCLGCRGSTPTRGFALLSGDAGFSKAQHALAPKHCNIQPGLVPNS